MDETDYKIAEILAWSLAVFVLVVWFFREKL